MRYVASPYTHDDGNKPTSWAVWDTVVNCWTADMPSSKQGAQASAGELNARDAQQVVYCYAGGCNNKPTHRLWDGDDHISVCSEHLDKHKRPQDEVEEISHE